MRENPHAPSDSSSLGSAFDLWRAYASIGDQVAHTSAQLLSEASKNIGYMHKVQLDLLTTWARLTHTPNLDEMESPAELAKRRIDRSTRVVSEAAEDVADTATKAIEQTVWTARETTSKARHALRTLRPKKTRRARSRAR